MYFKVNCMYVLAEMVGNYNSSFSITFANDMHV